MEERERGAIATLEPPTTTDSESASRSPHVQATLDAIQLIPIGQRRAFVQWVKLIRRRGYLIPQDGATLRTFAGYWGDPSELASVLEVATGQDATTCDSCGSTHWNEQLLGACDGDTQVCESCLATRYFTCQGCQGSWPQRERVRISGHGYICASCWEDSGDYGRCYDCNHAFHVDDLYDHNGDYYCGDHQPEDEPYQSSDCESRNLTFTFPALCTPQGSVKQDEVIPVTVGSGDISESGMRAIARRINQKTSARGDGYGGMDMSELLGGDFDTAWQNKAGNFPKRLAKHLLSRSLKLSDELMAECGNIAKAHTSKTATQYVSLTRDLNQDPAQFLNEGSCYWGEYFRSRCELKAWNGFGIRAWRSINGDRNGGQDYPSSRAWLIPLRVTDGIINRRTPIDTLPADAYILFNAYGELEQLPFARVVAGMTGKSYRKIPLSLDNAYVNAGGVLIAEQSVCDSTDSLGLHSVAECGCG